MENKFKWVVRSTNRMKNHLSKDNAPKRDQDNKEYKFI